MRFLIAAHTDVGIKKETNQDAFMVKEAKTARGKVCLCVLCDGIGGLSRGELASATVIRDFERWFETEFPQLLESFCYEGLKVQWKELALELNKKLSSHAAGGGRRMGTTLVALLLAEGQYFIMNVGDSRVYALHVGIDRLTKDQSLVQRQVDLGQLRQEEAAAHPRRNILLQCIGASEVVEPDFYGGVVDPGTLFLICSDGFCHAIREEEIFAQLNPAALQKEKTIKERLVLLTKLNQSRGETDNISAVAVRVCREEGEC